jgi:hypothetical protein
MLLSEEEMNASCPEQSKRERDEKEVQLSLLLAWRQMMMLLVAGTITATNT